MDPKPPTPPPVVPSREELARFEAAAFRAWPAAEVAEHHGMLLRATGGDSRRANSAALQVSDALSNVLLIGAAGSAFTALGGGSLTTTSAGASTSHPTAFAAVFLPAAAIAQAGAAISARLRPKRP